MAIFYIAVIDYQYWFVFIVDPIQSVNDNFSRKKIKCRQKAA
ncbi:hypothetical protein [Photobacterium makurazakiensis]